MCGPTNLKFDQWVKTEALTLSFFCLDAQFGLMDSMGYYWI